jgi:ferredoxin-NADP reductase
VAARRGASRVALECGQTTTVALLARHLPDGYRRFQYFICRPDPMMDAAESALIARLDWLIAGLIVIACIILALAQS